jgi:hypothetical protein
MFVTIVLRLEPEIGSGNCQISPERRRHFRWQGFRRGVIKASPLWRAQFVVGVYHACHSSWIGVHRRIASYLCSIRLVLLERDHESRENYCTQ